MNVELTMKVILAWWAFNGITSILMGATRYEKSTSKEYGAEYVIMGLLQLGLVVYLVFVA